MHNNLYERPEVHLIENNELLMWYFLEPLREKPIAEYDHDGLTLYARYLLVFLELLQEPFLFELCKAQSSWLFVEMKRFEYSTNSFNTDGISTMNPASDINAVLEMYFEAVANDESLFVQMVSKYLTDEGPITSVTNARVLSDLVYMALNANLDLTKLATGDNILLRIGLLEAYRKLDKLANILNEAMLIDDLINQFSKSSQDCIFV
jgi:hypothetical protein